MHRRYVLAVPGLTLGVLATISMPAADANATITGKDLAGKTCFHGMAIHPIGSKRFYLAINTSRPGPDIGSPDSGRVCLVMASNINSI